MLQGPTRSFATARLLTQIALLCGLASALGQSCTDDLGLQDTSFACDSSAPCADGWECVNSVCVLVPVIPQTAVNLEILPTSEEIPPWTPATGCQQFTICSRQDPVPGEPWQGCAMVDFDAVADGQQLEYLAPAGKKVQLSVSCAPTGGGESSAPMWSARSCPRLATEDEPLTLKIRLLPASAFSAAHDSQGHKIAMETPRAFHSCSTLSDGSVLVAGGFGSEGHSLASAELLSLDSGRFETLPQEYQMTSARAHAASVILPDGRLAIFGGLDAAGEPVVSVDLFNPETQSFTAGPPMDFTRAGHTATLLGSTGEVVLAGGEGQGGGGWAIWQPSSGVTKSGTLHEPRYFHTAAPVPASSADSTEHVLFAGGEWLEGETTLVRATSELLSIPGMSTSLLGLCTGQGVESVGRTRHVGVSLPQSDLSTLVGGAECFGPDCGLSRVCLWSSSLLEWIEGPDALSYPPRRSWPTASPVEHASHRGLLFSGGRPTAAGAPEPNKSYYMATVPTQHGGSTISMDKLNHTQLQPRWGHGAVTLCDGRVMLTGGLTGDIDNGEPTDSVEVFNPW